MTKPAIRLICTLALTLLNGCKIISPSYSDFNVIFISMDALRQDFLGMYGMAEPVSPILDRLSQSSSVFIHAQSQATSTFYSHRAVFLSKYLYAQHARTPEIEETMAGCLKNAGWRTAAFVDGGWMNGRLGHSVGFDVYIDDGGGFTRNIIRAMQWIEEAPKSKFFIFLHGYDVHTPFNPPTLLEQYFQNDPCVFEIDFPKNESRSPGYLRYRAQFRGEVRACDATLSQLFFALGSKNLAKNTIIVVFADHGESIGERDYNGHNELYEVQSKIPLFFFIPNQDGKLFNRYAESIDIMPTIFSLLKVNPPKDIQGIDLEVLHAPERRLLNRPRLCETKDEAFRVDDAWKLIIRNKPELDELYLPEIDIQEKVNLIEQFPWEAEKLRTAYSDFTGQDLTASRASIKTIYTSEATKIKTIPMVRGKDKEIADYEKFREQLRELGYIE